MYTLRKSVKHRVDYNENPQDLDGLPPIKPPVKYTPLYSPLDHLSTQDYIRVQIAHFFLVLFSSFLAIFSSLIIGSIFGDVSTVPPPNIGLYAVLVGLAHVPPLYIAFNVRTWDKYDVRINPYISLAEFALHNAIGLVPCLIELFAQAIGAVMASAFTYGVLQTSPLFTPGIGSPIVNTTIGWAFFLECFSGLFIGWIYFHNWYHDQSLEMPITMTYVVAGTVVLTYPFIGPTTHNPFRWLAACVIEQTCGIQGSWVFPIGPLVGIILGFLLHRVTWRVK